MVDLNEFSIFADFGQELYVYHRVPDCNFEVAVEVSQEQYKNNIYWPSLQDIITVAQKHLDDDHRETIVINVSERVSVETPVDFIVGPSGVKAISQRAKDMDL